MTENNGRAQAPGPGNLRFITATRRTQGALLGAGFAMVAILRSGWMLHAFASMQTLERHKLEALARRYLR